MSDEIYVNIGTSFQQPYQGQGLAQGRTPVIAQYIARQPANAQTPFTYQARQPANARQPSSAQTPYIANRQIPSIVQATANYPYIASAQQPYPYIANAQTTIQVTGRSPVIYNATGRTPFTYARQGQTPYNAQGRTPFTYAHQGRSPYSFQQSFQQPYARQAQQPYTFNDTGQNPFTYARQGQSPYSYQQSYQHPTIYTHQVSTNYQTIYRHPQTYNHQVSVSYRHPSIAQTTYRHPVIAQTSYQHPVIAQQPASIVGRQPTPYTYPDPPIWGPYPFTGGSGPTGYTYTLSGYRDGNVYAPLEYGSDFGSANFPFMPNSNLYDTEGWWSLGNPYSSSVRTINFQNLSHPNNVSPTNPTGLLSRFATPPAAPPATTSIFIGDATYYQVVTPSGTTNIPIASMTDGLATAPGAVPGNHYYLTVPTSSMGSYVLGTGVTGSLGIY